MIVVFNGLKCPGKAALLATDYSSEDGLCPRPLAQNKHINARGHRGLTLTHIGLAINPPSQTWQHIVLTHA